MLPKKAKRRKRDQHTERSEEVIASNNADATPPFPKILYLDEEGVQAWAKGQSEQNIEALCCILNSLCDLLSYRCNESMRRSILLEFLKCMSLHGVTFHYILDSRASMFLAREEYNGKYPATNDINQFFHSLSALEYGLRAAIWSFHNVQMGILALHSSSPL
ncbi:unnamed protein product [Strongylus vulgaris]|uniref:Uncharacterized protein n=1 Tax=Strongylus vulgaris TaxID=40348 RepID=A0A3P7K7L4_STRVU|nr:unnamed protein product [Strongylus vulgaris]